MGDLVNVTRCKNCKYYLTLEEAKNDSFYKDYPFEAAEELGKDGLCTNTDKWSFDDDFCSNAKVKEMLDGSG